MDVQMLIDGTCEYTYKPLYSETKAKKFKLNHPQEYVYKYWECRKDEVIEQLGNFIRQRKYVIENLSCNITQEQIYNLRRCEELFKYCKKQVGHDFKAETRKLLNHAVKILPSVKSAHFQNNYQKLNIIWKWCNS